MAKINAKSKSWGFTIVALLVVIVVIGILASISVVSYTGVTNKANTVKGQSSADSIANIADLYFAEKAVYPTSTTELNSGMAKMPSSVKLGALGSAPLTTGQMDIKYEYCIPIASSYKVSYWDFTLSTPAAVVQKSGGSCAGTYIVAS